MRLTYAPWRGPALQMHYYLFMIALCDFVNGLLGIVTLGTFQIKHDYFGYPAKGMTLVESIEGTKLCNCDACLERRGEPPSEQLSMEEIEMKMKWFQANNAPIKEVKAWFEAHGIYMDFMAVPAPSEEKDPVFH